MKVINNRVAFYVWLFLVVYLYTLFLLSIGKVQPEYICTWADIVVFIVFTSTFTVLGYLMRGNK